MLRQGYTRYKIYKRPENSRRQMGDTEWGWHSWLRHCATRQKGLVRFPIGLFTFFIHLNPSDRNTALGSTQPLTKMSTSDVYCG